MTENTNEEPQTVVPAAPVQSAPDAEKAAAPVDNVGAPGDIDDPDLGVPGEAEPLPDDDADEDFETEVNENDYEEDLDG
jgi:hypothetical protein